MQARLTFSTSGSHSKEPSKRSTTGTTKRGQTSRGVWLGKILGTKNVLASLLSAMTSCLKHSCSAQLTPAIRVHSRTRTSATNQASLSACLRGIGGPTLSICITKVWIGAKAALCPAALPRPDLLAAAQDVVAGLCLCRAQLPECWHPVDNQPSREHDPRKRRLVGEWHRDLCGPIGGIAVLDQHSGADGVAIEVLDREYCQLLQRLGRQSVALDQVLE